MDPTARTDDSTDRREPSAPASAPAPAPAQCWRFSRPPHPEPAREALPGDENASASPVGLATTLATLSGMLHQQSSVYDTLQEVVHLASDTVPGVEHAGITVTERKRHKRTRHVVSPAFTAEVVELLCDAHEEAGQGPCLDADRDHPVLVIKDMAHDPRWPRFARRAGRCGVGSLLVCHLATRGDRVETLLLYARDADAFSDDAAPIAALYAAHAALALWSASRIESLTGAVATRQLIGEAVGVLMATRHMTDAQAIELLAAASQERNVPLRRLAEYVTRTGALPDPAPPHPQRR